MKAIQVFDPALCCSTGVCGVEVDQALVDFSADVDWAQGQGAKIERFNLAQQPMAFAEHAAVKSALEQKGNDALPLVLVDGRAVLTGRYPTRDELTSWLGLAAKDAPSLFSAAVAELVAIGAAIGANCEPCLKYHVAEARKLGVSAADMRRAVDLAQKVKEAPARAMIELARRLLEPATAAPSASAKLAAIAATAAPVMPATSAAATSCCGPAPAIAPAASSCCGPSTAAPAATTTAKGASKCC
ncbi:MAG: arsenite efflux transporter metallochaperone ArsD [Rubrivivax sp.]|nr:arsenite efflux transporter metallochaperone ArsD [Rubrivivax sp.]